MEDTSSNDGRSAWFTTTFGPAPVFWCAPMVGASEPAFRALVRTLNVPVCTTPMLFPRGLVRSPSYGALHGFPWTAADRPLVVQFAARVDEADAVVAAAHHVASCCDAIEINVGCPQRCAKKGRFGAFLLDDPDGLVELMRRCCAESPLPVLCKMRVLADVDATVALAKRLEDAGVYCLTVHGRKRGDGGGMKTGHTLADWAQIRAVKAALRIPVVSNGNIRHIDDVRACLARTGADGIMSACGLLADPALFARGGEGGDDMPRVGPIELAKSYLDHCAAEAHWTSTNAKHVTKHLFAIFGGEKRDDAGDRAYGGAQRALLLRAGGRVDLRHALLRFGERVREVGKKRKREEASASAGRTEEEAAATAKGSPAALAEWRAQLDALHRVLDDLKRRMEQEGGYVAAAVEAEAGAGWGRAAGGGGGGGEEEEEVARSEVDGEEPRDPEEEEDDMDYAFDGPLDAEGRPHGRGTLTMTDGAGNAAVHCGRFRHGDRHGRGVMTLPSGDTISATFVEDELSDERSPVVRTFADGRTVTVFQGRGEERGSRGEVLYRGGFDDDGVTPHGVGTLMLRNGEHIDGVLRGTFRDGVLHGKECRFIYPAPSLNAADGGGGGDAPPHGELRGEWDDGTMVRAQWYHIVSGSASGSASAAEVHAYDESTATRIASAPLQRDPYETLTVCVGVSLIPNSGEGLFAKRDLCAGEIAAWYNGVRTPCVEVDGRPDWSLNDNVINLNATTAIDVPPEWIPVTKYCASLGHKANHARAELATAEYSSCFHPRFGEIKCVRAVRFVKAGEEVTCDYSFLDETPPWYDPVRDGLTVRAERMAEEV